jgi:ankyrin repeat protein
VKRLVKTEAEANVRRATDGMTPLAWAAAFGDRTAIVAELLKRGADPNGAAQTKGPPVLCYFIRHGHRSKSLAAVEAVLRAGARLDASDRDGQTALHVAALVGAMPSHSVRATRMLLDEGANPNLQDDDGRSALHCAVSTISVKTVDLLLAKGASVGLRDREGSTALHRAVAVFGDMAEHEINDADGVQQHNVSALLQRGADPNDKNGEGNTALALAVAQRGYPLPAIERLLAAGADPAAPLAHFDDKPSCTHLAISVRPELAEILLRSKPSLANVPNEKGVTPLALAAFKGHTALIAVLLELGADVTTKVGAKGVTALELASQKGHREIVAMLSAKTAR